MGRKRKGWRWGSLGMWMLLTAVPCVILAFALAVMPSKAMTWDKGGGALIGVAVIVAAAVSVVATNIARERHDARWGKACTKCGYDMEADPSGTCPECGQTQAARRGFHGPQLKPVLLMIGWVLLAIVGIAAVWRFGLLA